jgi:hypothetical protein
MRRDLSERVERAAHALAAALEDVGVDHRGAHILVAEELLDRADVVTALEQVRGEGVAQRVAGRVLGDAGALDGVLDGALDDRWVDVMAALAARAAVGPAPLLREYPLPAPLEGGARVLGASESGSSTAPQPSARSRSSRSFA